MLGRNFAIVFDAMQNQLFQPGFSAEVSPRNSLVFFDEDGEGKKEGFEEHGTGTGTGTGMKVDQDQQRDGDGSGAVVFNPDNRSKSPRPPNETTGYPPRLPPSSSTLGQHLDPQISRGTMKSGDHYMSLPLSTSTSSSQHQNQSQAIAMNHPLPSSKMMSDLDFPPKRPPTPRERERDDGTATPGKNELSNEKLAMNQKVSSRHSF